MSVIVVPNLRALCSLCPFQVSWNNHNPVTKGLILARLEILSAHSICIPSDWWHVQLGTAIVQKSTNGHCQPKLGHRKASVTALISSNPLSRDLKSLGRIPRMDTGKVGLGCCAPWELSLWESDRAPAPAASIVPS